MSTKNWSESPFGFASWEALEKSFSDHVKRECALVELTAEISKQRMKDVFGAWRHDFKRSSKNFRKNQGAKNKEVEVEVVPDHIKVAAFLVYWLRREGVILDLQTTKSSFQYSQYSEAAQHDAEMASIGKEITIQMDFSSTSPHVVNVLTDEIKIEDIEALNAVPGQILTRDQLKAEGLEALSRMLEHREFLFSYANVYFAWTFGFELARAYHEQKCMEKNKPRTIEAPDAGFVWDTCYAFKFKNVSPYAIDLIFRALMREDALT